MSHTRGMSHTLGSGHPIRVITNMQAVYAYVSTGNRSDMQDWEEENLKRRVKKKEFQTPLINLPY